LLSFLLFPFVLSPNQYEKWIVFFKFYEGEQKNKKKDNSVSKRLSNYRT